MANFVETATLRLIDKTSKDAKQINKTLYQLWKTSQKLKSSLSHSYKLKVLTGDVTRANTKMLKMRELQSQLRKQVRVDINQSSLNAALKKERLLRSRLNKPFVSQHNSRGNMPRDNNNRSQQKPYYYKTRWGTFPHNIKPIMSLLAGYDVARATRATVGTAGRATLEAQSEQSSLRLLGISDKEIKEINTAASEATRGMLNMTKTQAIASARNLKTAGASGDSLVRLTRAAAQAEAALTPMFGAERARSITETNIKVADLAGLLDTPELAEKMFKAGAAVQLRGGRDFNMSTFLAAIRVSGRAQSLTDEALVNFASAVDEQGQRAGSGLARFIKIMTMPEKFAGKGGGVTKGTVKALNAAGVRTANGAIDEDLLRSDFGTWIRKYIIPAIQKKDKNIDLDDESAVARALNKLGIVGAEQKFVAAEITKRKERLLDRAQAKRIDYNALSELANIDMGLALQTVKAQFKDFSSTALEPLFKKLSPYVVKVSKALDELEHGKITAETIGYGAAGAGIAAGGYLLANPHIAALGLAGLKLTGSAGALSRAAALLAAAAKARGVDGIVDKVEKGGKGGVSKTASGVAGAAGGTLAAGSGWRAALGTIALRASSLLSLFLLTGSEGPMTPEKEAFRAREFQKYLKDASKNNRKKISELLGPDLYKNAVEYRNKTNGYGLAYQKDYVSYEINRRMAVIEEMGYKFFDKNDAIRYKRNFPDGKYISIDDPNNLKILTNLIFDPNNVEFVVDPQTGSYTIKNRSQGVGSGFGNYIPTPIEKPLYNLGNSIPIPREKPITIDDLAYSHSEFIDNLEKKKSEISDGIVQALLAAAPTIGAMIAATMSNNFDPGTINIEATLPQQATDTGNNSNNVR